MIKKIIKRICPPIILKIIKKKSKPLPQFIKEDRIIVLNPQQQDLDLYWDPEYAKVLEEWGLDSTWNEIQLLLANCKGKILDVACGTGITIKILDKFPLLEIHGFDISDLLINKALEKGIPKELLKVEDATKTSYSANEFDYSYSIGSLEHFTEEGIESFLSENSRYTKTASFHMIPISKSNINEGWMKTTQSFFNNSEQWWLEKFNKNFQKVYSIPSKWEDNISYGRWFICIK